MSLVKKTVLQCDIQNCDAETEVVYKDLTGNAAWPAGWIVLTDRSQIDNEVVICPLHNLRFKGRK